MGCASSSPVQPVVEAPSPSGWTLVSDCLAVRKSRGVWVRGRVIATVDSEMHGSLLCVHLEGFSESTVLWLHLHEDCSRIAPLVTNIAGSEPPPTGPSGPDTEEQFARMVAKAQRKLVSGKAWSAPSIGAPSVFSVVGKRLTLALRPDPAAWLQSQQSILRQPFIGSDDACNYIPSCMAMYEAAVSGSGPPGSGTGAPFDITASGLMMTPGAEYLIENPSVHPPSPDRALKPRVSWSAAQAGEALDAVSESTAGLGDQKRRSGKRLSSAVARRLPAVEEERPSILARFSFRGSVRQSERPPEAVRSNSRGGELGEISEAASGGRERISVVGLADIGELPTATTAVAGQQEVPPPMAELSSTPALRVDEPVAGGALSAEGSGSATAAGGPSEGMPSIAELSSVMAPETSAPAVGADAPVTDLAVLAEGHGTATAVGALEEEVLPRAELSSAQVTEAGGPAGGAALSAEGHGIAARGGDGEGAAETRMWIQRVAAPKGRGRQWTEVLRRVRGSPAQKRSMSL